ncbi:MAG: asparagine synthetase B family protein, partial [Candidatus Binatia bacterium]
MLDGVRSLLPGHCLTIKRRRNQLEAQEFSFADHLLRKPNTEHLTPANRREAVTQLRSILEDSVCAHLVSDVPVAAFLSGGIDSSAVVGLMSRVATERPQTFSVSFAEKEFSEQVYAESVARKFGTEHRNIRLSAGNLLDTLPDAFDAMDQPTMDGINSYVVSKAVKEAGVTVALSGLGGDELFAGYPSFHRAMQLHRLASAPFVMRHFASTAGRAFTNGSARHRKFWDLVESNCSPYAAYAISRRLFAPDEIAALTGGQRSAVRDQLDSVRHEALGVSSSLGAPCSMLHADLINEVSRYELGGYMANTLLRDTDQMSMAHALEVRVPFVDREIVNYVT